MKKKIGVIGAGSWGTAVANVFADAGQPTTIWARDKAVVESIQKQHVNPHYLKDTPLAPTLQATGDLPKLLAESDWLVNAIPTQAIRAVYQPHAARLSGKALLNTSKGIEMKTHRRVSEIFADLASLESYSILSGPSFALETARKLPTAVTVASEEMQTATEIQTLMHTPYFRTYSTTDVAGVELAGALKNVIAIASGIISGLKLGYNAQAALINRGIAEIIPMGKKWGADPMTFFGLSGVGDMILTCTGPLSRNRNLGILLGEGHKLSEALTRLGGVAEGYYTAQSSFELAKQHGLEMPITEQVYAILYEGSTPQRALTELMGRDLKTEW